METESLIAAKTTVAGLARAAWLRTLTAIRSLPECCDRP
jgi:hypothetical protein